ncbi:alpha/beta hydrolase [Dactylosporangium sp. AC04546]|uniref:alpha/beta fold hydrolase n=1 Tax=Dactylosporangium sp. AC04546 TaxID=2862460 RepID=UPI001EDCAFF7|nr:alpha/beta hydrolase [Dactylosporangium sp. AC04546]WVK87660.1 alpha/beta hydrolase [Dactylosporangium sp. AC04546]
MTYVLVLAAAWGVTTGLWMPRGPLTTTEALTSIAVSAAVGLAAGRLWRSRWTLLAAPAAFLVALELARIHVRGPSVDAPHASAFGFVALVAGRGVHGLLSVFPMLLFTVYGRGLGRRWKRIVTGVATAALVVLTALVAIPARTAPIPTGRGVAELTTVHGLNVMIRGVDPARPVLLFLPGAPGGSELGAMRKHLSALEEHFVVATLDRRGAGASYAALHGTVTMDDAIADTVAVTDYLRTRFHQEKIFLLGHSGGSLIGALTAHRHPERYRAYIGTGQAVDVEASDKLFYDDILSWARAGGRTELVRRLTEQGPPPWKDVYAYEPIMLNENAVYHQSTEFVIDVPEYTLLQRVHTLNAVLDTWTAYYPQIQDVDLRREVRSLAVPAYFVQGSDEMRGLAVLFDEWYATLEAPEKHLETFEGAGHRAMFEQPDRFVAFLASVSAG